MAKYLTPDRSYDVKVGDLTLNIKEKIIPDSARATKDVASYVKKGDPMKPMKLLNDGSGKALGVVIHNTNDIDTAPETNPAEQYTRATWPNCNMNGAVVHFYVWKDQIWQNLSLQERGWHAGDGSSRKINKKGDGEVGGNVDCIAIECIGDDPESTRTTAALAAWLLKNAGLTVEEGLYTHKYFMPNKNCPEYILPIWDSFEATVKSDYAALGADSGASAPESKPESTPESTPAPAPESKPEPAPEGNFFPPCPYTGRSIVDGLKSVGANSSFAYRRQLASANGIAGYIGLATQNTAMLKLLKSGKLKKV